MPLQPGAPETEIHTGQKSLKRPFAAQEKPFHPTIQKPEKTSPDILRFTEIADFRDTKPFVDQRGVMHGMARIYGHTREGTSRMEASKSMDNAEFYETVMLPAINQASREGAFASPNVFRGERNGPVNEKQLSGAMEAFLRMYMPAGVINDTLSNASAIGDIPTLGDTFKLMHQRFPKSTTDTLAYLMREGLEGYTLAEALGRYIYEPKPNNVIPDSGLMGFDAWKKLQEIEHPEQYHLAPIQADISEGLRNLLKFPISFMAGKIDLSTFTPQTVGQIFARASDQEKLAFMQFMQYSKVARLMGFDAIHYADESNAQQHEDTDEEAWRKLQGNYPISPDLVEKAARYANREDSGQGFTSWGRNGEPYRMRGRNLEREYAIHHLGVDFWQELDKGARELTTANGPAQSQNKAKDEPAT